MEIIIKINLTLENPLVFYNLLPLITFPSLVPANPTQPTTNRKTETDFGEEADLNGGAVHGYDELVGYLWAKW